MVWKNNNDTTSTQRRRKMIDLDKQVTKQDKASLGFKSSTLVNKIKSYFKHNKEQRSNYNNSRWRNLFIRKKTQIQQTSNSVSVGTIISLNVPITISTTHYHNSESNATTTTSLVERFIILPPLQVYGFLFLSILFLLVIAFGLLQVHRIISIIQSGVDGIKYTLVNIILLFSRFMAWGKL